jgi:hypothetical protein
MPNPNRIPAFEDLPLQREPDPTQLDNIKTQLDLVLLALESIANIGSGDCAKPTPCAKVKADGKNSMSKKPAPWY